MEPECEPVLLKSTLMSQHNENSDSTEVSQMLQVFIKPLIDLQGQGSSTQIHLTFNEDVWKPLFSSLVRSQRHPLEVCRAAAWLQDIPQSFTGGWLLI